MSTKSSTIIGVYPGTFDPITNGHLDIIERATKFVDHLIVGIAIDSGKNTTFSAEKRYEIVTKEVQNLGKAGKKIEVKVFSGLLVNFAESVNANVLIRGLRAISDFEYEFQMSCMNSKLKPEIETIFLPASEKTHFISSRLVKEVARLGGDITGLVSENVQKKLIKHFGV